MISSKILTEILIKFAWYILVSCLYDHETSNFWAKKKFRKPKFLIRSSTSLTGSFCYYEYKRIKDVSVDHKWISPCINAYAEIFKIDKISKFKNCYPRGAWNRGKLLVRNFLETFKKPAWIFKESSSIHIFTKKRNPFSVQCKIIWPLENKLSMT